MKKEEFIEKMQEKSTVLGVRFFVEQTEQFFDYMNLLIEWNEKMNLTAITEEYDVATKHFLDCLAIFKEYWSTPL